MSSSENMPDVALVWGNPGDGFKVVAPVTPNDPKLDEFIDQSLRNETWWFIPLRSLSQARSDINLDE